MPIPSRRLVVSFVAAAAIASVLASFCSTQFVIAGLSAPGIDIPPSTRLAMTLDDLGILKALLPAIAACWLVAFPVAALCSRKLGGNRMAWFAAAGGIALVAELLIINAVLGVTIIAGARSLPGLACLGLAGVIGGAVFAHLTRPAGEMEAHDA